jgi:hypothetical protein
MSPPTTTASSLAPRRWSSRVISRRVARRRRSRVARSPADEIALAVVARLCPRVPAAKMKVCEAQDRRAYLGQTPDAARTRRAPHWRLRVCAVRGGGVPGAGLLGPLAAGGHSGRPPGGRRFVGAATATGHAAPWHLSSQLSPCCSPATPSTLSPGAASRPPQRQPIPVRRPAASPAI